AGLEELEHGGPGPQPPPGWVERVLLRRQCAVRPKHDQPAHLGAAAVHQRRADSRRRLLTGGDTMMPNRTGFALALFVALAALAMPAAAAERLELVRTIPLESGMGRYDHMAVDAEHGRLFIANLSNNSLDVVDLKAGKLVKQIAGQKKIQGTAYVPD